MIKEIVNRRSIRKYREDLIPEQVIQEILTAGMLAPSSKNRQPWRFVVVSGEAKKEMLTAMHRGLERERNGRAILPGSKQHQKGAQYTLEIMRQAPVVLFVINPMGMDLFKALNVEERIYEVCNMQSIGAALENMSLAAVELGLGSLWICDIFFAYQELSDWLGNVGAMVAAMALGYACEQPAARPRKKISDIVEWRK